MKVFTFITVLLFLNLASCTNKNNSESQDELEKKMNAVAEKYVKLVLELGNYDPGYVDAYYGPPAWKPHYNNLQQMDSSSASELNKKADNLLGDLETLKKFKANEIERLRYRFLYKQLFSIKGYITILNGGKFDFDTEAEILYDAKPTHYEESYFKSILNEIYKFLPGNGDLTSRWNEFRNQFIIPAEKLDKVFNSAISECRNRTLKQLKLPPGENFKIEYVTNQPWGAYNWFKGNSYSIIQVNTDLPVYIDRAIDLAAHEGYPGHHVFNSLLENNLVKKRGWIEYSVYPLYSPVSLLAEGTANFGIEMIFPDTSAEKFEKEILFPLAGLDTSKADLYYKIRSLLEKLDYATNEAAQNYLDGKWDKNKTLDYLQKYRLITKQRAEKTLQFIEHYRSYVINYNLGEQLVRDYIEKKSGNEKNKKWEEFELLLSTPQTPSGLISN